LATQVPVLPVCGIGTEHFAFGGQAETGAGTAITQSKSALGQSATLVQTIGLGSQTPVILVVGGGLVSTATPASGPEKEPASTARTGGVATEPQLVPSVARQGPPAAVPVPELPTLPPIAETVCVKLHWYPVSQSTSLRHSMAAAVRSIPTIPRRVAAAIGNTVREYLLGMA
jgi:hypothetical protein